MSAEPCPLRHQLRLVSGRFCSARCTVLSARGCPKDCEHRPVQSRFV